MSAEEQTGKSEWRGNIFSHYCVSSGYQDISSGHQVLSWPLKHIGDEIVRSPRGQIGPCMEYCSHENKHQEKSASFYLYGYCCRNVLFFILMLDLRAFLHPRCLILTKPKKSLVSLERRKQPVRDLAIVVVLVRFG